SSLYLYFLSVPSSLRPSPPGFTLFPYTTLFRSGQIVRNPGQRIPVFHRLDVPVVPDAQPAREPQDRRAIAASPPGDAGALGELRSEEHTSELQSRSDLVCRLLLEKKKMIPQHHV